MRTREAARELLLCVLLYLHNFTEQILNIIITFQNITTAFLDLRTKSDDIQNPLCTFMEHHLVKQYTNKQVSCCFPCPRFFILIFVSIACQSIFSISIIKLHLFLGS